MEGTKRLFPTDYQKFIDSMIEAAEEDELPVVLQLDEIKDFTLKDLQDLFFEFTRDTGLDIEGRLFICDECGSMHLALIVNYLEEENSLLQ